MRIDEERLRTHFEALTGPGATEAGGLSRPALSEAHLQARHRFLALIDDAGLEGHVDGAGNHSAFLSCGVPGAPTLLFGSHLDSVPNGGRFDGTLGVATALEALQVIHQARIPLAVNLEAIDLTDEEGTFVPLMGSRALAGLLHPQDLAHPRGAPGAFQEALRRAGLTEEGILSAARGPETLAGYVELHIEQGPRLITSGIDIGIVTSIVGIASHRVTFHGRADHAGTMPVPQRQDAAQGACAFALAVRQAILDDFPACVANVGQMTFKPGAFNIVPETVEVSLECRAPEADTLERLQTSLLREAEACAAQFDVAVSIEAFETIIPVPMHASVQQAIRRSAERLGLSHHSFYSGAGHDAQALAAVCPAGMLFVPSVGACSHSPREFTPWRDCVNGANTLLHTVLSLAAAQE